MMWGKKTENATITLEEAVAKLSQTKVMEILVEVGKKAVNRYKEDLKAEIDENADEALRKFRDIVVHRSWLSAQKWCKWGDEAPILMPDNTRIYYRRGDTEVVVQEFAPQMRLMKFTSSLACRESSTAPTITPGRNDVHSYSLALPYLVFIFRFREGMFLDVNVAFNDRPLKNMKERPLRPYLSNLDSGLKLCLGRDFDEEGLVKGQLAQQAAYILSHFWQTVYSDEWSAHFWNNKTHFGDIEDFRLQTLEAWQDASIDNPLFVVDDVAWMPHNVESFGEMVTGLFENDKEDNRFQQSLYDDVAEVFADEVKTALLDQLKVTDTNFRANHVEMLAAQLLEHFQSIDAKIGQEPQD